MARFVCTESRFIGDDFYAEGETYSMDAARAEKYRAFFQPLETVGFADAFVADPAPSDSDSGGMAEESDAAGGFVVPEHSRGLRR